MTATQTDGSPSHTTSAERCEADDLPVTLWWCTTFAARCEADDLPVTLWWCNASTTCALTSTSTRPQMA
jgi:hypothetical protein